MLDLHGVWNLCPPVSWGNFHWYFADIVLGFDGALAACLVLLCGTLMAPAHRRHVAGALLIAGIVVTWFIAQPGRRLPRAWWPITATYLGGLGTFAALWRTIARPPS
jgi:hypothetical protein